MRRRMAVAIVLLMFLMLPDAQAQQQADRLAGIGALLTSNRAEEAHARIEQALEAYQKEGNRSQEAMCDLLLGATDMRLKRLDSARSNFQKGVALYEEIGDHFGAFLALMFLATFECQETNFDESEVLFRQLLAVLDKAALPGETFSYDGVKSFCAFFGADFSQLPAGMLPPEIMKPFLLGFASAMAHDGYGSTLVELGKLDEAEQQLAQARSAAGLFGPMFESSFAGHLGDLRRRQWRLEEAREFYLRALGGMDNLPVFARSGGYVEIEVLDRLADVEMLRGCTDEALAWNDRAAALVRQAQDRTREARVLVERAELLQRGNRLDEAEAIYRDALPIAEETDDLARRGSIYRRLGMLDMLRGRFGTAAAELEQAANILHKAGDLDDESLAWVTLSQVYTATNAMPSARAAAENAVAAAARSGFRASKASAAMALIEQKFFAGELSAEAFLHGMQESMAIPEAGGAGLPANYSALIVQMATMHPSADVFASLNAPGMSAMPGLPSLVYLLEARRLIERQEFAAARGVLQKGLVTNQSRDFRANVLALIGTTWFREGNAEKTIESMSQAANALDLALDDIRAEEMLSKYLGSGREFYFDFLIEALVNRGRAEAAFSYAEQGRARAMLRVLGNTRIEPRRGSNADLVGEAETLRAQIFDWQNRARFAPYLEARKINADLTEAKKRYEGLLVRLKVSNPEYRSMTSVEPLNVADIRGDLPPDTTLVSYYLSHWHLYAWLVDRDSLQQVTIPIDDAAVARLVCWSERLARGGRGVAAIDPCNDGATAEQAYELLFAPLAPKIRNRRLIIVPHRSLHYVPFAALRNPHTNRVLVEDYTITYAPSASVLRFLRAKETPVDGGVLVMGDPTGAEGDDLPHAVSEAVGVARGLGAEALLGANARESRIHHLDGKIDLVHIAAHGVYDSDNPLFSHIALAPGEGEDGDLEVDEILRDVDLTGVNLVVLAACDSARGKRSGGDDIVSLTRALLYAGTPGVVSTLWAIDDDATAELMNEFYCRLLAGDSAADALRGAQIALLHGGRFKDPGQWAAFTLTGNPLGRWSRPTIEPRD